MRDTEEPPFDECARELATLLLGVEPLDATLDRISRVAARTLGGVGVSVTLVRSPAVTAGTSAPEVAELDQAQYDLAEGPAIDAVAAGEIHVLDQTTADRWPRFAKVVDAASIGSVVAAPLRAGDGVIGSLNVYVSAGRALDDPDGTVALLAEQVAAAVANADRYDECRRRVDQLEQALQSRVVIEQAKGILMERHRCGPDAAFDRLRHASQHANRKIGVVAREVIASATR